MGVSLVMVVTVEGRSPQWFHNTRGCLQNILKTMKFVYFGRMERLMQKYSANSKFDLQGQDHALKDSEFSEKLPQSFNINIYQSLYSCSTVSHAIYHFSQGGVPHHLIQHHAIHLPCNLPDVGGRLNRGCSPPKSAARRELQGGLHAPTEEIRPCL